MESASSGATGGNASCRVLAAVCGPRRGTIGLKSSPVTTLGPRIACILLTIWLDKVNRCFCHTGSSHSITSVDRTRRAGFACAAILRPTATGHAVAASACGSRTSLGILSLPMSRPARSIWVQTRLIVACGRGATGRIDVSDDRRADRPNASIPTRSIPRRSDAARRRSRAS